MLVMIFSTRRKISCANILNITLISRRAVVMTAASKEEGNKGDVGEGDNDSSSDNDGEGSNQRTFVDDNVDEGDEENEGDTDVSEDKMFCSPPSAERDQEEQEIPRRSCYNPFILNYVSKEAGDLRAAMQSQEWRSQVDCVPTSEGIETLMMYRCIECRDVGGPICVKLLYAAYCDHSWTGERQLFDRCMDHKLGDEWREDAAYNEETLESISFSGTTTSTMKLLKSNSSNSILVEGMSTLPKVPCHYVKGFPCTVYSMESLSNQGWYIDQAHEGYNILTECKVVVKFTRRTRNDGINVITEQMYGYPVQISTSLKNEVRILGGDVTLPTVMLMMLMSDVDEKRLLKSRQFPLEHFVMEGSNGDSNHIYPLLVVLDNMFRFDMHKVISMCATVFGCLAEGAPEHYIQYNPECKFASITEGMLDKLTLSCSDGRREDPFCRNVEESKLDDIFLGLSKDEVKDYSVSWKHGRLKKDLDKEYKQTIDTGTYEDKVRMYPLTAVTLPFFSNGRLVKISCVIIPTLALRLTLAPATMVILRGAYQSKRTVPCRCFVHGEKQHLDFEDTHMFTKMEGGYMSQKGLHNRVVPQNFKFVVYGEDNSYPNMLDDLVPKRSVRDAGRYTRAMSVGINQKLVTEDKDGKKHQPRLDDGEELWHIFDKTHMY